MKIIYLDKEIDYELPSDTALCLGTFDGVHKGHQALIKKAKSSGKLVAVLTFTSSPKYVLDKTNENHLLTPMESRVEVFNSYGVDIVIIKEFSSSFYSLSAEQFLRIFLGKLHAAYLVVGYDFTYGKGAIGTIQELQNKYETYVVEPVKDEKGKISTTRTIKSLLEGNLKDVYQCLGRYYSICGIVVHGLQNGRKIGFPTINMELDGNYYLPQRGVYYGYVHYKYKHYLSIINVGKHPTIDELDSLLVECHLIDANIDLYGEEVKVEFKRFIRPEKKFPSFADLQKQLQDDVLLAKSEEGK